MNKPDAAKLGGTMSEQQVLPELTGKLDFTERQKAITLADDFQNEMHDATFAIVERERQLLTALASLAQSEAERERHIRHILDISIALDFPVGMNAVEYGKQLRAERERLQKHCEYLQYELNEVLSREYATTVRYDAKLYAAEIELARERELNQGLRQSLIGLRNASLEFSGRGKAVLNTSHATPTEMRALFDLSSALDTADYLLADKSKPVEEEQA